MSPACVSAAGLVLAFLALVSPAAPARAAVLPDATSDEFSNTRILDIRSVEITNDASDLTFTVNLVGDPVATNWGKYMIASAPPPAATPPATAGVGQSRSPPAWTPGSGAGPTTAAAPSCTASPPRGRASSPPTTPPTPTYTVVPEPGSIAVLGLGALTLLKRRR